MSSVALVFVILTGLALVPELVREFRRAHLSTLRGRAGNADTEELRPAFLRSRVLLVRLLEPQAANAVRA
jgi:hypothetical protein